MSQVSNDRYKEIIVAYLHDIGKVYQRADRDTRKHDEISAEKIRELFGEDYEKLFREEAWREADEFTAGLEREEDEALRQSFKDIVETPLQSPLSRDKPLYYSIRILDVRKDPDQYYLREDRSKAAKDYGEVRYNLDSMLKMVRSLGISNDRTLLETINYVFKSTTLFVPAAVYKTVPDTTLYGHSKLTAAFASISRKYVLVRINIKGIQRFVTNVIGETEASKRFRGRSLFLQLFQQVLVDYLVTRLGYSEINNIAPEPGEIILLIDENDRGKALELIEGTLKEIFRWSNYELQFEVHVSGSYDIKDKAKFKNAYQELWRGPGKLIGETAIEANIYADRFGDFSKKTFEVVAGNNTCVRGSEVSKFLADSIAPQTFNVSDHVSLMNILSIAVGHSSRNLRFIIEVLYSGNERVTEPLLCYDKINVGGGHIMLTRLFIEPLKALLILVSADNELDVASLIKSITSIVRIDVNKVDLIKVLKVNDSLNFIPKESHGLSPGILSKTVFGWVMMDTHHPITESGVFKSLDEMGNYIALGVVDADELGSRIRALAERPGVFEGFSTILSFAINYVPMKVRESLKECSDNLVVLYSGGDDVAVYGRWDCVLEFLASVAEHVNKITGLSMSGGIAIFRTKYPIYYAYNEARRLEGVAKRDVKRMAYIGDVPGAVSMTVTEPYIIKYPGGAEDLIQSFKWNEIRAFLKIAQALLSTPSIPSSLLYRLYEIGDMVYDALRSGNETYLARALVTYAYTYIRNEKLMQSLGDIVYKVGAEALKIPQYPKVDGEDVAIPNLLKLKTVINMYSLLSRTR